MFGYLAMYRSGRLTLRGYWQKRSGSSGKRSYEGRGKREKGERRREEGKGRLDKRGRLRLRETLVTLL
jgi:hypothetical protein